MTLHTDKSKGIETRKKAHRAGLKVLNFKLMMLKNSNLMKDNIALSKKACCYVDCFLRGEGGGHVKQLQHQAYNQIKNRR